jgi:hypothetical protein
VYFDYEYRYMEANVAAYKCRYKYWSSNNNLGSPHSEKTTIYTFVFVRRRSVIRSSSLL